MGEFYFFIVKPLHTLQRLFYFSLMDTAKAKQHIEEINKQLVIRGTSPNTQLIRLAGDVFFIGPVLMYAGIRKSDMPIVLRVIICGIGAATIYYNLKNFIQVEKIIHDLKKLEETKDESPRK